MPLNKRLSVLVVCLAIAAPSGPASAKSLLSKIGDAVGYPVRWLGGQLGKGVGEKIGPALQPTINKSVDYGKAAGLELVADVNTKLTQQTEHVRDIAEDLLGQGEGAVTRLLGRTDDILSKRILQVEQAGGKLVKQLDRTVANNLRLADRILQERSDQLGDIVSNSLTQADRVLEQRIDQMDQAVALRLGNVDVIATKQRLGLEQSILRIAVLLGVLVFVVLVLWTLWRELPNVQAELAKLDDRSGLARTWVYCKGFSWPVLTRLAAAAAAVGVLFILYDRLPFGARTQAKELADMHRQQMTASLARFDFSRTRFHASQLEILVPEQSGYYQAMATKSDLMRDLLLRPASLATSQGRSSVVERIRDLERQLSGRADPDFLTLKALVIWQTGDSKQDEYEAASLGARALRLSPGGFALAPLARHYVRSFLHAPYVAPDTPYGRNSESPADLAVLAQSPIGDTATFPLASLIDFDTMLAELDDETSSAYLAMVRAQAELGRIARAASPRRRRAGSSKEDGALVAARDKRNQAAADVVAAWDGFDAKLAANPGLINEDTLLAIFRLNDATYTRAAWYVKNRTTNAPAPLIATLKRPEDRAALAPPRTGWESRYAAQISRQFRTLAAFQAANRFLAFEKDCADFERAYAAGLEQPEARTEAARLAADLGLFEPGGTGKASAALGILGIAPAISADLSATPEVAAALARRGLRFL